MIAGRVEQMFGGTPVYTYQIPGLQRDNGCALPGNRYASFSSIYRFLSDLSELPAAVLHQSGFYFY